MNYQIIVSTSKLASIALVEIKTKYNIISYLLILIVWRIYRIIFKSLKLPLLYADPLPLLDIPRVPAIKGRFLPFIMKWSNSVFYSMELRLHRNNIFQTWKMRSKIQSVYSFQKDINQNQIKSEKFFTKIWIWNLCPFFFDLYFEPI